MMSIHTRMTPAARKVVARAIRHARELSDGCVTVPHLLLAISETRDNHAANVLASIGMTSERARTDIPAAIMPADPARFAYFSPAVNRVVYRADGMANMYEHERIGLQHLLLAITVSTSEAGVHELFRSYGVSLIRVRSALRAAIERDDVQLGDLEASFRRHAAPTAFVLEPEVDAEPQPA